MKSPNGCGARGQFKNAIVSWWPAHSDERPGVADIAPLEELSARMLQQRAYMFDIKPVTLMRLDTPTALPSKSEREKAF
ncbi:MAG TPA: hypothetical protein VIV66_10540 [Pyrinomonadaceae bacterium]